MPPKSRNTSKPKVTQVQVVQQRRKKKTKNRRTRNRSRLSQTARDYLTSLLFPNVYATRIPDFHSVGTSVLTLTYEADLVPDATYFTSGILFDLNSNQPTYKLVSSVTGPGAVNWTSTLALTNSSSYINFRSLGRIVSAGMTFEHMGSNNSSCRFGGCFQPSSMNFALAATSSNTINDSYSTFNNVTHNLAKSPVALRWKPLDNSNDEFSNSANSQGRFTAIWIQNDQASVHVKIVANMEFVPITDSGYPGVDPSPTDQQGFEFVRNLIRKCEFWTMEPQAINSGFGYAVSVVNNLIGNYQPLLQL